MSLQYSGVPPGGQVNIPPAITKNDYDKLKQLTTAQQQETLKNFMKFEKQLSKLANPKKNSKRSSDYVA